MLKRIFAVFTFPISLLAPVAALFLGATSMVYAASPNVVISQAYGGGGNTGSTYRNDFIELFNRGNSTVSLSGWTVQYNSAAGTGAWQSTPLSGSIPPGGYFLVQEAAGAGGTTNLPTPEVIGTIAMGATGFRIALVSNSTLLTGTCPTGAQIVDFLGAAPTATCSEGSPTAAPTNTTGVLRALSGCNDVDTNSTDFATGTPNPRNSATAVSTCNYPELTIDNVSVIEGNSGVTTFTFTVSLSAPAGVGGVSFNIATANGTASSINDYVAKTLTSQSIAQGNTTYTFTVDVIGETTPELDETFFVNVTNLVRALPVDAQGLGTIITDDPAPNLTINNVSQTEGDAGTTTFTFTVSLSAPAPLGGVTFDIATADSTATAPSDYTLKSLLAQSIAEGNVTYTFDVVVNGDTFAEGNETFQVNVTNVTNAVAVTTQGIGTIVNDDVYRIHAVQGSGNASPVISQVVTVEGIVTASYQGAGTLLGYFIQEPDGRVDADPATSEGIFVFTNATPASVAVGDLVRVTGTVTEFGTAPNTLTEIGTPTLTPTTTVLSTGNPLPTLVTVSLPVVTAGDLERYEGMRVRFTQTLTVSDNSDLAQYGEITVTANGRALQPTNVVDPNDNPASGTTSSGNSNVPAVTAFADLNRRSSVILDGSFQIYAPTIPFLDPTNTIRLGTTVSDVTGVLSQLAGTHRVYPDVAPVFNYAPRPMTPPVVGGDVKVASANVLNYFNGDGLGGGFPTPRGATTLLEFNRQRAKIIAALLGLDADVVGLIEMENDGNGANSSIQDLINGLNSATAPGAWAFIPDPAFIGTDEIRSAIIYRTAVVAPVGSAISSADAEFNRPPIAQTFRLLSSNEQFTLVVNHFKSKSGSGSGADNDQGDGQAEFNNKRRLQAQTLLTFMATLTATPRILTMGDFNAYEQEDPIDILRAGGFATIINGDNSYTFQGQSGSLDHALGNAALTATVTGAGHWHINADEPIVLDYNVETKNHPACIPNLPSSPCTSPDFYAASPFRASDHDPVLVGLLLPGQCQPGYFSMTGNSPCTGASPGNFVSMAGATGQMQCNAGTYQPASRATTCISASPGSVVGMAGATTQTQCLAGTFQMNAGGTVCDLAQAGNFVLSPGATSQTACLAGTFQPNTGSTSCNPAQPGNFVTGTGATSQTPCAPGSFQPSGSQTSCGLAQPGFFVAGSGAISQTMCAAGTTSGTGATSCTAITFNVTSTAGTNGTIAPSGVQTVAQGATPAFTVTPDTGFSASVTGCGGSLVGNTYTTAAITADCTVTASFSLNLALVAVQSRRLHAGIPYDIAASTVPTDPPTMEPRTIGTGHTLVFQFNQAITAPGTATVINAVTLAPIGSATTAPSGNDVVVTITGVSDNQRVTVSLTGVNGSGTNYSVLMGYLVGDINNSRSVNSADISGVKARSGQTTTAANFKFDVNATGGINSADISAVKARSGMSLP